jgi:hypothetical protein
MLRPRIPRPGDPLYARDIAWILKQVFARLRGGQGIRVTQYPEGDTIIANTRKRGGGGGGALCPKWNFRATADSIQQLQIFNPGTIGGLVPEYDEDKLDLVPPPLIDIPGASGEYIVFLRFEWEPDVVEFDGDFSVGQGGTLIEPIEVIVAPENDPPDNEEPVVNSSTGAVEENGIYHRRIGKVERDGTDGPLIKIVSDHCFSLDFSICSPRIVLGSAS